MEAACEPATAVPSAVDTAAPLLASGVLGSLQPTVEQLEAELRDLVETQRKLMEEVASQVEGVAHTPCFDEVAHIMKFLVLYQSKVATLKKEMAAVSDKVRRLGARSDKLARRRRDQEASDETKRQKEAERDRALQARVVSE